MSEGEQQKWKPGKRDLIFVSVVVAVVLLLVLGTSERTTKPTPNDETHVKVTSREECKRCHDVGGIKPWPAQHTKADQCYQCHLQPENSVVNKR